MKKLIVLIFLFTIPVMAQKMTTIDTGRVISGGLADSTKYWSLKGDYSHVYLIVSDTGSTYTDSLVAYSVGRLGTLATDSVLAPIGLIRVDSNSVTYGATSHAGFVTKYLLWDTYIDKLWIVFKNSTYVAGRRIKYWLMGIKH
jgi:hypothetical protein